MNTFSRIILLLALAAAATPALAGSLTPPGAPAAGSGMPTTSEIYNRLDTGAAIAAPGAFREPAAGPTIGTGRSLSEIQAKLPVADNINGATAADVKAGKTFWGLRTNGTWGLQTGISHIASLVCQANWSGANCDVCANGWIGANCDVCPAHWTGTNCDVCTNAWSGANCDVAHPVVNKTGQTTSYATGDDGYYRYGIDPPIAPTVGYTGAYNTPPLVSGTRFTDNGDGTVTDNQTALIWLKNAICFGYKMWSEALAAANTLVGNNTQCGLSDGSTAGQWRLPNINELHSLGPTWPPGTPFTSVQDSFYWSSSRYDASYAWFVNMSNGFVFNDDKYFSLWVWPVRGGQ